MIKKYPNDSVSDFYKCTEEIAEVLDKYFGREHGPVSGMSDINTFIEEYANGWVKLHDTGHIKTTINSLKARMREIKRYQNGDPDWYDEYLTGY